LSEVEELVGLVGAQLVAPASSSLPRISDVVADSRRVTPASLFCCVTGAVHDGHDHAAAAVQAGAVALLCERELPLEVPQLVVPDVRSAMAPVAARVHGDPSRRLDVIGVTGTNGKTTVVSMVAAILSAAGRQVRTIGTLTGERTTPEAPDLQRQLAAFVAEGVDAVAMEVSSHALALHRVDAVEFAVAVFTNLGIDHLDFHGTPEAYFAAKALLFEPGRARVGVVNVDDVRGRLLLDAAEGPMVGVGLADAGDLRADRRGSTFEWHGVTVRLTMHGRHNVSNALVAAEACRTLGVDVATVAAGLSSLPVVPGRFETIDVPGGAVAVVDYAHTPEALEEVLAASRDLAADRGRVTIVFGCGGDRDRSKRPRMGEVASRLADRVIVTSDNPRSEDPGSIISAVVEGCEGPVEVVPDRAEAIATAFVGIGPDDVVLVAGKGHEQGQVLGDRTLPFDDREQVRAVIDALPSGSPANGSPA
jgi:UDP-N-acetylmuramoyl-L-alanyl-D-glutamate--2,6-diaminopimelate ligase